jgi:hypothetical protein
MSTKVDKWHLYIVNIEVIYGIESLGLEIQCRNYVGYRKSKVRV